MFRVWDVKENKYPERQRDFQMTHDGKLLVWNGTNEMIPADPDRYIVDEGTVIEGIELFVNDIFTIGSIRKLVGHDEYGFYIENYGEIRDPRWRETKERPYIDWWKDFKEEIEVTGNKHKEEL